jgi:predicted RNA-binding protein YlxR (DUF448 family)
MHVPDPRGRLPGRGAYLHPDLRCLDSAERRRAFARALRLTGPLDLTQVRGYLTELTAGTAPVGDGRDTTGATT